MKVSDEEKARQRALELERLKQSLFDSNKSTDPRDCLGYPDLDCN